MNCLKGVCRDSQDFDLQFVINLPNCALLIEKMRVENLSKKIFFKGRSNVSLDSSKKVQSRLTIFHRNPLVDFSTRQCPGFHPVASHTFIQISFRGKSCRLPSTVNYWFIHYEDTFKRVCLCCDDEPVTPLAVHPVHLSLRGSLWHHVIRFHQQIPVRQKGIQPD